MRLILMRRGNSSLAILLLALGSANFSFPQAPPATNGEPISRVVGSIKTIQADSITVSPDSGPEVVASLTSNTRILHVPPGETDLKKATPLRVQDLQTGDRVLVRGQAIGGSHSMTALSIIVMKQSDLSAKQERDREDWQKRGVGGLVKSVDLGSGDITISAGAGKHNVVIHTTKNTVNRRYASDSVKFDDARPASLAEIKPDDQLRARGTRNADGSELTAEEIVSGTFRNIAGIISAVDAGSNSVTVQDTIRKGHVVIRFSSDSQIKKLPAEFAQRMALRFKAMQGESDSKTSAADARATPPSQEPAGMQGARGNGTADLQRFLNRLPNAALSDLKKGDAVMVVSTDGQDSEAVTAITILAGVEPLLTSSAERNTAMMLSQWSLGSSVGEAEGGP